MEESLNPAARCIHKSGSAVLRGAAFFAARRLTAKRRADLCGAAQQTGGNGGGRQSFRWLAARGMQMPGEILRRKDQGCGGMSAVSGSQAGMGARRGCPGGLQYTVGGKRTEHMARCCCNGEPEEPPHYARGFGAFPCAEEAGDRCRSGACVCRHRRIKKDCAAG